MIQSESYWNQTGFSKIVYNLLSKNEGRPIDMEDECTRTRGCFGFYGERVDLERLHDPFTLVQLLRLFGYLSITTYDRRKDYYTIGFPNKDTKTAYDIVTKDLPKNCSSKDE